MDQAKADTPLRRRNGHFEHDPEQVQDLRLDGERNAAPDARHAARNGESREYGGRPAATPS